MSSKPVSKKKKMLNISDSREGHSLRTLVLSRALLVFSIYRRIPQLALMILSNIQQLISGWSVYFLCIDRFQLSICLSLYHPYVTVVPEHEGQHLDTDPKICQHCLKFFLLAPDKAVATLISFPVFILNLSDRKSARPANIPLLLKCHSLNYKSAVCFLFCKIY